MKKFQRSAATVQRIRVRERAKHKMRPFRYSNRLFVRIHNSDIEGSVISIGKKYGTQTSFKSRRAFISAPEILSLKENGDDTVGFLQAIREIVPLGAGSIAVKMQQIKKMSPTCAMLFASEMDRMKRIRGGHQKIPDDGWWNPSIKQMFGEIGVFELVNVDNNPNVIPAQDAEERYVSIRSGTVVDMEKALKSLISEVASIKEFVRSNPNVVGAITEAITNVRQWAYNNYNADVPEVIVDRWWFLASYNTRLRRFSILVFDHGQGIPTTLRRLRLEALRELFPGNLLFNDADAIEAAFLIPRSATGQRNRGKGLKEMRNLLDKFVRGSLRVVSGRGEYLYDCATGNIDKRLYKYDIGGTLVAWEIFETGA